MVVRASKLRAYHGGCVSYCKLDRMRPRLRERILHRQRVVALTPMLEESLRYSRAKAVEKHSKPFNVERILRYACMIR
jgi:hypothetical protein